MAYINLATEDALSEAIAEKLIKTLTNFNIQERLGRRGNGHLKTNLKSYMEIARHTPLLLLTDLDQAICAPSLSNEWLSSININPPSNFLFRIATREIESWLLADFDGCRILFGTNKVPSNPDQLNDPKAELLRFASRARREIRDDLVKKIGPTISKGLGYNVRLRAFVLNNWNPLEAAVNSPSLERTCIRLRELNTRFNS
jgi:hypothetical protein